MISSRWKKIWADFWGNKSRTFLTILTIMVGDSGGWVQWQPWLIHAGKHG